MFQHLQKNLLLLQLRSFYFIKKSFFVFGNKIPKKCLVIPASPLIYFSLKFTDFMNLVNNFYLIFIHSDVFCWCDHFSNIPLISFKGRMRLDEHPNRQIDQQYNTGNSKKVALLLSTKNMLFVIILRNLSFIFTLNQSKYTCYCDAP